jgi:hypothetical protein
MLAKNASILRRLVVRSIDLLGSHIKLRDENDQPKTCLIEVLID